MSGVSESIEEGFGAAGVVAFGGEDNSCADAVRTLKDKSDLLLRSI